MKKQKGGIPEYQEYSKSISCHFFWKNAGTKVKLVCND
ncbi:hypothetical protein C943_04003 [Mariniradius saccharolyticus AK6]|uniref:Uncharacterized protein n=1 Tax=Mariniradius saccharolyticus AK6 TaxID=1239962 RepID=M7X9S6_9BACT|nr:hypothetical protein C943_04003 [Mariniradius saccharolyticus AK6]